jgi:phosphatidate phosphatase PAH1
MPFTENNTKYQYLRLNDGKELFAMVREIDNKLELHFPMNIMCKPAVSGGVTIHLGPFIPFTTDDSITINSCDVVVRTSITDQFVEFYDEACTAWLDMRENNNIEIKTTQQDFQEQQKQLSAMIKDKLQNISKQDMWDEYNEYLEEEELELLERHQLPGPKETIH